MQTVDVLWSGQPGGLRLRRARMPSALVADAPLTTIPHSPSTVLPGWRGSLTEVSSERRVPFHALERRDGVGVARGVAPLALEDDPLGCLRRAARPDQRPHLPEIHWRLRQRLGLPEGEAQGKELRAAPAKDPGLLREDRLLLLRTLAHMHTVGDRLPSYDLQKDWAPSPKGVDAAARHGGFALDRSRLGRSGGRAAALTVCVSRRCRALADRAVGHTRSSRWTTRVRQRFRPWPAQALAPTPSGEASC